MELAGNDFVLQIGDGAGSEVFTTLGGLRTKSLSLNNAMIESTNHGSNQFRTILPEAGIRSFTVSGAGIMTDSATLSQLRVDCLAGVLRNFRLIDGNGLSITGAFKIVTFEQSAEYNAEHAYSISLESSGELTIA